MPKALEAKIRREYASKGKTGKALDHAVFGTLNSIGAMHGNKVTAQGERMESKYVSDHPGTLGSIMSKAKKRAGR